MGYLQPSNLNYLLIKYTWKSDILVNTVELKVQILHEVYIEKVNTGEFRIKQSTTGGYSMDSQRNHNNTQLNYGEHRWK